MGKKYKDKKNAKLESGLTQQELNQVKKVEDHIDDQIDIQWESGSILIDECIVQFECDPENGNPTSYTPEKRILMRELLFSRYRDSDWRNNLSVNGQRRFTPINIK